MTGYHLASDHVEYEFELSDQEEDYYCSFRYSELFVLYRKLEVRPFLIQSVKKMQGVEFPPKKLFGFLDSQDKLAKERLPVLRKYFKEVTNICAKDNAVLREFVDAGRKKHFKATVKQLYYVRNRPSLHQKDSRTR